MRNFLKVSIVILLLLIMFNHSFAMGRQLKENVILNKTAPDFTLYDIKGEKITLADFKHKNNVMLFFWFSRCPFCLREISILNKVYPGMKNDNLKFLSINVGDEASAIKKYVEESGIAFPVLLDSESDVALKYNLVGVPTYVIIDKQGIIKLITNEFPNNYQELIAE